MHCWLNILEIYKNARYTLCPVGRNLSVCLHDGIGRHSSIAILWYFMYIHYLLTFLLIYLLAPWSGVLLEKLTTRVGTLIVATIYLQLIQYIYMFRSFNVLHCSHQHCVQTVASDVEVVGYL